MRTNKLKARMKAKKRIRNTAVRIQNVIIFLWSKWSHASRMTTVYWRHFIVWQWLVSQLPEIKPSCFFLLFFFKAKICLLRTRGPSYKPIAPFLYGNISSSDTDNISSQASIWKNPRGIVYRLRNMSSIAI